MVITFAWGEKYICSKLEFSTFDDTVIVDDFGAISSADILYITSGEEEGAE